MKEMYFFFLLGTQCHDDLAAFYYWFSVSKKRK